jgi:hypothetical protein
MKTGSGIRKLSGGDTHRHTDNKVISYACSYFFQNKENRLINKTYRNTILYQPYQHPLHVQKQICWISDKETRKYIILHSSSYNLSIHYKRYCVHGSNQKHARTHTQKKTYRCILAIYLVTGLSCYFTQQQIYKLFGAYHNW